jgi:carboxymethylenebutenolidase
VHSGGSDKLQDWQQLGAWYLRRRDKDEEGRVVCDERQLADMGRTRLNRREFTRIGAVAALAACAPAGTARAQGTLNESMVKFAAPGGTMDAYYAFRGDGKHPAAIIWPDIAGLRDSFKTMGLRLARGGYSVLVLNPYYRNGPSPQFADFDAFRSDGGMEKVAPWREQLTAAGVMETAKAAVAWLDVQDNVDTGKGIGVQGYCMSGPFAVWSAAASPERVKAVASFHGASLVSEDETSPVKMLAQTQANYLFAIGRNDDRTTPGDKDALKAAAAAAGRQAEVEVFKADHGWTVDDSPAYDLDVADEAWDRLKELYATALS